MLDLQGFTCVAESAVVTKSVMKTEKAEQAQDAGAPELEITPKMIEAGVNTYYENAIWGWDNPGNDELRQMLKQIFKAMYRRHEVR